MKHAEKSRVILELLEKRGALTSREAAEALDLSAPTIRRVFKHLADAGTVRRVAFVQADNVVYAVPAPTGTSVIVR